jgi:hypothetical protein
MVWQKESGKNNPCVCQEFGLVNSIIQTIWKNKTTIINVLGQNGLKIKQFQKPEQSDINQALLMWFKHETSDNVSVSRPLLMMIFVFPKC